MRLIDADRLKAVIKINMVNNEIKAMFNQYVDSQPTFNGWHDLTAAPEDLPKDSEHYVVEVKVTSNNNKFLNFTYLTTGQYINWNGRWNVGTDDGVYTDATYKVIRWKE